MNVVLVILGWKVSNLRFVLFSPRTYEDDKMARINHHLVNTNLKNFTRISTTCESFLIENTRNAYSSQAPDPTSGVSHHGSIFALLSVM